MAILKSMIKGIGWLFLITGLALMTCSPAGAAEPLRLQEQKIKAGLLYNFIKYSSWPENIFSSSQEAFQVCMLGGDGFDGALDPLQGRTAQQRNINIRNIYDPEDALNCHVVFVNRNQTGNLQSFFATIRNHSILTVSDIEGFSNKGGMIEFSQPYEKRIHVYLDRDITEQSHLRIGDQLLRLVEVRR